MLLRIRSDPDSTPIDTLQQLYLARILMQDLVVNSGLSKMTNGRFVSFVYARNNFSIQGRSMPNESDAKMTGFAGKYWSAAAIS